MASLRENVTIKTPTGEFHGELFVGADGLPSLRVRMPVNDLIPYYDHSPWTLPITWIVTSSTCGPLYSAWDLIWNLIEELAIAEREAEAEKTTDATR